MFKPLLDRSIYIAIAITPWVLTWKMVDGEKRANDRLAEQGCQDPDLRDGNVDTSGCVSLRSSHLRVISLGALKIRQNWSLDDKNASRKADGLGSGNLLRAPMREDPWDAHRTRKLHAPASGLRDAQAAFRRSFQKIC